MDVNNDIKRIKEAEAHPGAIAPWGRPYYEDVMEDGVQRVQYNPPPWTYRARTRPVTPRLMPEPERRFCNRCVDAKPLRGMAWCGRCAIKYNLKLRYEDDPNLEAIRANIALFKRLLKIANAAPPVLPDKSMAEIIQDLVEVYEDFHADVEEESGI